MKKLKILLIIALVLLVFSCQDPDEIYETNSTLSIEQEELLGKMNDASLILSQMVLMNDVHSELSSMISRGVYRDDYVPFKDLFSSQKDDNLKSVYNGKTLFESAFDEVLITNTILKSLDVNDIKEYLIKNELAIYIPYPLEDYPEDKRIPTITFHPLLNDSINVGFEPIIENQSILEYKEVKVDENYSTDKPLYIVVPISRLDTSYGDEEKISCIDNDECLKSANTGTVNEIRIGYVYLSKQYDGIFDGGSELRFVQGSVEVNSDGHVGGATKFIPCDISRKKIKYAKKGWEKGYHYCGIVWDTNWQETEIEISMAVYEKDSKSKNTATSTSKYTDETTGLTNSLSNSWEYYSNDDLIYNLPWDRNWFFSTNKDMEEWAFRGSYSKGGFPHRKLSEYLKITTPNKILAY